MYYMHVDTLYFHYFKHIYNAVCIQYFIDFNYSLACMRHRVTVVVCVCPSHAATHYNPKRRHFRVKLTATVKPLTKLAISQTDCVRELVTGTAFWRHSTGLHLGYRCPMCAFILLIHTYQDQPDTCSTMYIQHWIHKNGKEPPQF